MPALTRRRFVLLSAVALLGAACGSTEGTGLRGSGTVLYPRDADARPTVAPTPALGSGPGPTEPPVATPVPTPRLVEPIVPPDSMPAPTGGSTDAEMHVVPVPSGKPP